MSVAPDLPGVPAGPLRLGMFGKHPVAADHLEDAGLVTPALADFKRQFYVEGLGGCIHRSAWQNTYPYPTPLPYDHRLLTMDAQGWTAARFVAARDASGRSQYPFVGCLHGTDHRWLRAAAEFWPWLDEWTATARRADTLETLHGCFESAWADVRDRREDWEARCAASIAGEALSKIAGEPELARVAQELSRDGGPGENRVRVPLPGADPAGGALQWASFVSHLLAEPVVTVVWKADGLFADLASGPPDAALFQPLFSPASKVPLTTVASGHIDPDVLRHVEAALAATATQADPFAPSAESGDAAPPPPSLLQQTGERLREWWYR